MYIKSLPGFSDLSKQDVSSEIYTCMAELEQEVYRWMNTFDAWDERKHPAIMQFLSDINGHCRDLYSPGGITLSVIMIELDRLSKKLDSPKVSSRVEELKKALDVGDTWRDQTLSKPRHLCRS